MGAFVFGMNLPKSTLKIRSKLTTPKIPNAIGEITPIALVSDCWRIFVKKNYSEVATKRGVSPPNPRKWAPIVGLLNLAAGGMCAWVIISVLMGLYPYNTWSAMAGITIWGKIFADLIVRMQAHPFKFGKKKQPKAEKPQTP